MCFSELIYSFGDDTMATLKKQRRIDTDNRIKAAAVEVFAEYGYERAQLSYMSKIAGISMVRLKMDIQVFYMRCSFAQPAI